MPAKLGTEPMVRKNYFFHSVQIDRLKKIAAREKSSVAQLLREGADLVIAQRVAKIKAEKAAQAAAE